MLSTAIPYYLRPGSSWTKASGVLYTRPHDFMTGAPGCQHHNDVDGGYYIILMSCPALHAQRSQHYSRLDAPSHQHSNLLVTCEP